MFAALRSPSQSVVLCFLLSFIIANPVAKAFTGSEYILDTEYAGRNFFDGWDFFTGRDPTNGFVTYYSRSSSYLTGLINSSDVTPAYIGVDYINELPITPEGRADGAGRPSVRISSRRSWTHGLFIGDFDHAPNNICGTWPAFWTLGPNWPYTGEIDIMEGVNKMTSNIVSLHTNDTCSINSTSSTQLGVTSDTDCAYHPGHNVGCGVVDTRPASYSDFNAVGGGVYAMQWTSEYIRVWFFPRSLVPQNIIDKQPDPSTWGLPASNLMGDCLVDQHFQQHTLIFDTTFCGDYAGNQYVWNSQSNSCLTETGYPTCDAFVSKQPGAFRNAYWSINYVRVYQLVDPVSTTTESAYIASLQPKDYLIQASTTAPAPSPTALLCPIYNFTTIQNGGLTYEIECGFDPPGPDLPPPYLNYTTDSFEDCVTGCTYWNTINGSNLCGAVAYDETIKFCYYKKYVDQPPKYRAGFAGARLIYYGYPEITDDPRSTTASVTSVFVETIPTPQFYRPTTTVPTSGNNTITSISTTLVEVPTIVPPPLGTATNETVRPTINPGTPTVSYSGSGLVPVTNVTSSMMNTDDGTYESKSSLSATSGMDSCTSLPVPATCQSPASGSQLTSTNTNYFPGPTVSGKFQYIGCRRPQNFINVFNLTAESTNMTIQSCTSKCSSASYAGVHGSRCYCADARLVNSELIQYPDSACNISCPGDADQKCGGDILPRDETTLNQKRQLSNNTGHVLLTLYRNTALVNTDITSSTNTLTVTLVPVSPSTGAVAYSTTNMNTMTVTAVATTWCDFCSACPENRTTLSTVVTMPCPVIRGDLTAAHQIPTIPMMTTIRHCNCGLDGAMSSVTVTVPCETKIASLKALAAAVTREDTSHSEGIPYAHINSTRTRLTQPTYAWNGTNVTRPGLPTSMPVASSTPVATWVYTGDAVQISERTHCKSILRMLISIVSIGIVWGT